MRGSVASDCGNLATVPAIAPPNADAGEGGALASRHSSVGFAQRSGILRAKHERPLLTDAELAKEFGVSSTAIAALLASVSRDLQPTLRTYADDVGEAYLNAVLASAKEGKWQGSRAFLVDAGAIPRPGADNRQLTITVSAPPGTPGYSATEAPPMLADVYDTPAGPPLPTVRDDEP
jgi:hypothetical protein